MGSEDKTAIRAFLKQAGELPPKGSWNRKKFLMAVFKFRVEPSGKEISKVVNNFYPMTFGDKILNSLNFADLHKDDRLEHG